MNSTVCSTCYQTYPDTGVPFRCPRCGGIYEITQFCQFDPHQIESAKPGLWRYAHTFNPDLKLEPVSLGEGNAPLIWDKYQGKRFACKLDYLNPTGSFKDRGSAIMVSFLKGRGVNRVIEDSSGNAGASLAAYAARAGIQVRIFLPHATAGLKRKQIEVHGARLELVSGSRARTAEAVLEAAELGEIYASHAYLPFNLLGYATIAYELFEQMGEVPRTVILPVGQGGLLLGLARGFQALLKAALIPKLPRIIGVQALACAPLFTDSTEDQIKPRQIIAEDTIAEGIRVINPLRREAVLEAVKKSGGSISVVDEQLILPGRDQLAQRGFYIEPTSAVVWPVLEAQFSEFSEPIVLILTGSGYKYWA